MQSVIKSYIDACQKPSHVDVLKEIAALCRDLETSVHHEIKLAALKGNTHFETMLTKTEEKQLTIHGYKIKPGSFNRKIVSWA
jgi:hypothetical protein